MNNLDLLKEVLRAFENGLLTIVLVVEDDEINSFTNIRDWKLATEIMEDVIHGEAEEGTEARQEADRETQQPTTEETHPGTAATPA